MTQPTPTDYPIYRNILLVLVRGVAVLALAVVFLLAMVVFAIRTPPGAETASRTIAALMAVVAIVLAWIGIRTIGSRITVTSDGVFVHTVFRRCQFISWTSIADFDLISASRLNNQFTRAAVAIAVIQRHQYERRSERGHERRIGPLYCIGVSFTERSPAATTMLEALRSELRIRQPAGVDQPLDIHAERPIRRDRPDDPS